MASYYDLSVGDRVELTTAFSYAAKKGATGTVIGKDAAVGHRWIRVKWDRNGLDNGQVNGSYEPGDFKKITDQTAAPSKAEFVIMLKENGVYKPAVNPVVYATEGQANAIAETMAKRHGGEFVVFKTTLSKYMPKQVEPTTKRFA